MDRPKRRTREQLDPADLAWPWWIPWMTVFGAILAGVEALRHRYGQWGANKLVLAVPMVGIALVPLVLDALAGRDSIEDRQARSRLFLPRWLWATLMGVPIVVILIDSPTDTDFAPFLLVLMSIQAGAVSRFGEGIAIVAVTGVALLGLEVAGEFDGTLIWVFGNFAAWAGGLACQKSLVLVEQEKERHEEQMASVAQDERRRIAREVHDVIAHSLSVTMLHLTGARRALETGADPEEAAGALRDAERLGRQAMNDIRRTVGLLAPETSGETTPMPTVADIPNLVDDFASAGLKVTCDVEGDASVVSLASGLGLYRIAQESLSNIAKHAPGAATTVTVDVSGQDLALVVRNAAGNGAAPLVNAPDVGGLGLRGMEERARLLGGRFRAGPDDGGWLVSVSVPRSDPANEPSLPASAPTQRASLHKGRRPCG